MTRILFLLMLSSSFISCQSAVELQAIPAKSSLILGDQRTELYFDLLNEKKIGLVANQSSYIGETHLLDTLLSSGINVVKIFSPEHGFRGQADAGEILGHGIDSKTKLPIVSLYGKNKKPTAEQLKNIDLLVFDIQDVGVRFYTYISTLHYLMEAAAENSIPLIVLDRPNPHAHYVDGPIIEDEYKSFVGMHAVPIVYGMTIGEYAMMINGEEWLKGERKCNLQVISCENYNRNEIFTLPIKPSPNLPNALSVQLYPSLCFFEGTVFSAGRGTEIPFQFYGHPKYKYSDFQIMPKSMAGAKHPKFENQEIFGMNLSGLKVESVHADQSIRWDYLWEAYANFGFDSKEFFINNNFFEKLVGTQSLRNALEEQLTVAQWKKEWEDDLEAFKQVRVKYLLY